MTRRERMERRIEKRREWSASRARKSQQSYESSRTAVDGIPFGQPILVGHHSERTHRRAVEKSQNAMSQCVEHSQMAKHHESKANNLESALERTIFTDDPDAIERLEERIAQLEEKKDGYKRVNAAYRKYLKNPDCLDSLGLSESEKIVVREFKPMYGEKQPYPTYCLANLNQRIKADRDRIADIKRRNALKDNAESSEDGISRIVKGLYTILTFSEKPSREILTSLKASGFRWDGTSWSGLTEKLPDELKQGSI